MCFGSQFTEANKADQLAKLSEARAAQVGAPLQKFKFVSALNEQVPTHPPITLQIGIQHPSSSIPAKSQQT